MYIGGSVMYVQNITDNLAFQGRIGDFCRRVGQKAVDVVPEITLKEGKKAGEVARKIEREISKPHTNRLIMGATAILTQPFIDYHNHKVDEETRSVARNRTIAKIVAGTGVGLIVRKLCYDAVQKMTDAEGAKKYSKALLPDKSFIRKYIKNPDNLKHYGNALSNFVAIIVMCFATNFLFDAPLTTYFTNRLNEKTAKKKAQEQQQQQRKGIDVYA